MRYLVLHETDLICIPDGDLLKKITTIYILHNTKKRQIPCQTHYFINFFLSVTCMIMQKNGAGLHTASSCFWNNETDGSCTVRWENKTMYCIVSVFGLAI